MTDRLPASRPPQNVRPSAPGTDLLDALLLSGVTEFDVDEARAYKAPLGEAARERQALVALLEVAFSPWGSWSEVEQVDDLASNWLFEALCHYPLWAAEAGLRAVFLSSEYRPKPAEILAAVQKAFEPLTSGIKAAEARIEARERQARLSAPKSKAQIEAVQALLGDLRGRMGEEGDR